MRVSRVSLDLLQTHHSTLKLQVVTLPFSPTIIHRSQVKYTTGMWWYKNISLRRTAIKKWFSICVHISPAQGKENKLHMAKNTGLWPCLVYNCLLSCLGAVKTETTFNDAEAKWDSVQMRGSTSVYELAVFLTMFSNVVSIPARRTKWIG